MLEISPGVYIGSIRDYGKAAGLAILSATQTVHYPAVGFTRSNVDKNHTNYLSFERANHLTLNWVDGPAELYDWGGEKIFSQALHFIEQHNPVLIHCNKGRSRAPTLGLLYLSKRLKSISNASFEAARDDFSKIYPKYKPGGIAQYVADHWHSIK